MANGDDAIQRARFGDLGVGDLHDLLQLRSAVFVVEQACAYLDVDGRDAHDTTEHLWVRDAHGVVATVRLLHEPDGERSIGRVATRPDARQRGVASRLMSEAVRILDAEAGTAIRLGAQAHLAEFYARFGFAVSGAVYVEDGIDHVPMRREAP